MSKYIWVKKGLEEKKKEKKKEVIGIYSNDNLSIVKKIMQIIGRSGFLITETKTIKGKKRT
jgi:hypothetical protein